MPTQIIAKPMSSSSAKASTASTTPLWIRQPIARPVSAITPMPMLEWIRLERLRPTRIERPRDRQRLEPVDEALLEVVRQPDRHDERREDDRLRHDPGDQELPVVAEPGHVDRAAEDEGEQQHEHHRLDGDVHQQLGHPPDVEQVAPDDGRHAWTTPAGSRSPVSSGRRWLVLQGHRRLLGELGVGVGAVVVGSSARWPVRCRNTSSRLGRWQPEVVDVDAGCRRTPHRSRACRRARSACAVIRRARWVDVHLVGGAARRAAAALSGRRRR